MPAASYGPGATGAAAGGLWARGPGAPAALPGGPAAAAARGSVAGSGCPLAARRLLISVDSETDSRPFSGTTVMPVTVGVRSGWHRASDGRGGGGTGRTDKSLGTRAKLSDTGTMDFKSRNPAMRHRRETHVSELLRPAASVARFGSRAHCRTRPGHKFKFDDSAGPGA